MPATSPTAIAVTCRVAILGFLVMIFKPVIEIDGQAQDGAWSRVVVPATAGQHRVAVYWKYFWFLPVNRAETTVMVADGTVVEVSYKARLIVLLPGKIAVTQPVPAAA